MGETYKAMVICRAGLPPPIAFEPAEEEDTSGGQGKGGDL